MFVFIFNTTILFDPIEHIIEKRPKKTNTMNILSVEVKFYTHYKTKGTISGYAVPIP